MRSATLLLLLCVFGFLGVHAQQARNRTYYKKLPVLQSGKDTLFIAVGDYRANSWLVSPQVEQDSLRFSSVLPLEAKFVSDVDSISYEVGPGQSRHFYVKLGDRYAHTVIYNRATWSQLSYDKKRGPDSLNFFFDKDYQAVPYLVQMRELYPIDSCVRNAKDDAVRVLNLLHWVHTRWKHDGNQSPQKGDALSILEEAKTGKGFPCFAYAEVLRAALNSIGIPTRRLALKTKDVETEQYASGHVANEVYLRDQGKWVFVDPQEDVMPYLNGVPLNAVEFQQAVTKHWDKVELRSISAVDKMAYLNFVYPYLYYFDSNFDHRYSGQPKISLAQKSSLMLVPKGAKNPTKAGFYNNQPIDYCLYTNCKEDFYKAPVLR